MDKLLAEFKTECDQITSSSVVGHQHFDTFLREHFSSENAHAVQALFKVISKNEELSQKLKRIDDFKVKLDVFSERLDKLEDNK